MLPFAKLIWEPYRTRVLDLMERLVVGMNQTEREPAEAVEIGAQSGEKVTRRTVPRFAEFQAAVAEYGIALPVAPRPLNYLHAVAEPAPACRPQSPPAVSVATLNFST